MFIQMNAHVSLVAACMVKTVAAHALVLLHATLAHLHTAVDHAAMVDAAAVVVTNAATHIAALVNAKIQTPALMVASVHANTAKPLGMSARARK